MNRVLAQARIELIQITRDRMALILILALPVVLLVVIGSATTLKVSHLPIGIQDFDGSGTSREFADAFRASNSLYVVSWPTDRGPEDAFLLNTARAALAIPPHFERHTLRRRRAPVKVLALTLVALAESIPMLVTLKVYFGASFAGDPTPFIVGTVLYAFCIAAFGVMAGAAIPVRALATQVVSIGGFMLTFLLSGLIFPVDNIPWQIRWISDLVWAKHYISVVRDAVLQGRGWRSTRLEIVIIPSTGLVFYAIAG